MISRWKAGPALSGLLAAAALLGGCGAQVGSAPVRVTEAGGDAPVRPSTSRPPGPAPTGVRTAWPGFGRDSVRSGASPAAGPRSGRTRWRRRLEGAVVPGPAIGADGTIYAASNGGVLHALDPRTGRDRWTFDGGGSYGIDLSTTPLLVPEGLILWPGPQDTLFALDADGRERWRVRFDALVLSPVRGDDGTVYVADMGGGLRALDISRVGVRERWRTRLGDGPSYGSPALGPDGTIYGTSGNDLVAVRADGAERWRFAAQDLVEVSPAVGPDGTVVLGTNDRYQYGIGPDGRERWRFVRGALTYSSPAVTPAGLAYFGDHRGRLNVLDVRTGTLVARHVGLGRSPTLRSVGIWTAPVIDRDGNVYFGTRPGHVYGFTHTGRRLFDLDTGASVESYPALGLDGSLYIGSENGLLYAIGD